MKNEIMVFENEDFGKVRTVAIDNEPYFCLVDVCEVLEIGNPSQAKTRLRVDGVISNEVGVITGKKSDGTDIVQTVKMNFINESNLYKLVFQSRKPQAEKFSDWVTDEVLPTIRKTGGYVSNDNMFIETYLPFADEQTKLLFRTTLDVVRKQNNLIEEQKKEIVHKENVIIGLVDDIDLTTKRQRITQIIRYKSKNYAERYNLLYSEFEKKYHLDLDRRLKSDETSKIKPKIKNKMDYIDRVMNKIPELYEICCKLFENDVKVLLKEWETTITNN